MKYFLFRKNLSGFESIMFGWWLLIVGTIVSLSMSFLLERRMNYSVDSVRDSHGQSYRGTDETLKTDLRKIQNEIQEFHQQSNRGFEKSSSQSHLLQLRRDLRSYCTHNEGNKDDCKDAHRRHPSTNQRDRRKIYLEFKGN